MTTMEAIAFTDRRPEFRHLDSVARYANMTPEERMAYDADLKAYRDMMGQLEFSEMQGFSKGEEVGMAKGMAKGEAKANMDVIYNLDQMGMSVEIISKAVNMPIDKIKSILSARSN